MLARLKEDASLCLHWACSVVTGFLPRKNHCIVFCNYDGRGYGDNLAPIADEIHRRKLNYELVWLVKDLGIDVPSWVRRVVRGWFREKSCLSRAKIVICNLKGLYYHKRRGNYYIQTWHGDMPFKYIEAEEGSNLSRYYILRSRRDSKQTNFVLSGSSFFSSVAKRCFWYPEGCQVLEYGIPRNDIFFRCSRDEVASFRKRYFGSTDVRVAFYAPTFRERLPNENCRIDAKKLKGSCQSRFGGKWIVVIRLHPNVADKAGMFEYGDGIVNGTRIDDAQMLSLAADVLITDYSSIVEEFVIQRKPIFLYAPDLDEYVIKERKLRELYFRLPFPHCRTEDALQKAIADFDDKAYRTALGDFVERDYRVFDDGHASERVVDLIEKLMG